MSFLLVRILQEAHACMPWPCACVLQLTGQVTLCLNKLCRTQDLIWRRGSASGVQTAARVRSTFERFWSLSSKRLHNERRSHAQPAP